MPVSVDGAHVAGTGLMSAGAPSTHHDHGPGPVALDGAAAAARRPPGVPARRTSIAAAGPAEEAAGARS